MPPGDLLKSLWLSLSPAADVWDWVQSEILADTGSIHNPDHAHLMGATIGVLWASRKLTRMRVRRAKMEAHPFFPVSSVVVNSSRTRF